MEPVQHDVPERARTRRHVQRRAIRVDIYIAVRPPLPAGATLDVPMVRHGAWDAALSTGALRLIDYDVVAGLSDIYQMQESYGTAVASFVTGMPPPLQPPQPL